MRDKLEKRIVDKPDDLARHDELLAWLKDNDPERAEFIEVQVGLENHSIPRERRFELETRERQLLNSHGRKWIGDLSDFILTKAAPGKEFELRPGCQIWWFRGWVQGLQLDELTLKLSKVLLNSPELRLFRRLVLTEPVNASCDYLHEWGLLEKIKQLDLSFGRISEKGALALAGDKSIRKLESLDLTSNQISEEGVSALRKAFPRAVLDDQSPVDVKTIGNDSDD